MTIQESIIQDLQRVVDNFEASISDFQSALNNLTETADLQLIFRNYSKMGVGKLVVDAVRHAMLRQN